ncbi:GNAT family N-acetyltransferase [Paenibacillus sp. NFR01]|uniref:GNAT family N-acetyltransferase n=1 Tax=Paenibacillus sp. NFR01 TaxID=1566279 RepID=UPI0008BA91D4|nr:GNAT family N-acetyltransferase [Paenibacillus sp. NFR01]SET24042.1 Predicted acetyltransferase [Paenibacillus sp. NFR01]
MTTMDTHLIAVDTPKRREILHNLIPLYLHDLSAYTPELQPNNQGRYEYDGLHLYEQDERLHACLIYHAEQIAGFVLVNEPPYTEKDVDYCVNELFVLNGFRKKGVAQAAIRQVFDQYPGKYLVFQLAGNARAVSFWRKVYERNNIAFSEVEEIYDGDLCVFQRFTL